MSIPFTSCEIEDGDKEIVLITESEYFLKINVGGNYIDVNHGLDYQVKPNLTFDNSCEVLFGNCRGNSDRILYLASSFGKNQNSMVNFAITNLAMDLNSVSTDELDFFKLVQNLPKDEDGSLIFTSGNTEDGIKSGNIYFGTNDNLYTYTYNPVNWAKFKITRLKNEIFNDKEVIAIGFEVECRLFDDITGEEIIIYNGSGYLPFSINEIR